MTQHQRQRIGLFIAGGVYAYQTEIIVGAHEECERLGLDLICLAGGSLNWEDPRNYPYRIVSPADLDAAILVPGTWNAALDSAPVRDLMEPYLAIPSCIIGARCGDVPSVCIDNEGGVAEVTRHVIEAHDRKRVAFIAGRGVEAEQRHRGYERALRELGFEPDPELFFQGHYTLEGGHRAAARWTDGGRLACDAIIAANDWMATGALEVLQERGLRVPEDVSLVGFDDVDRARFMAPPLTTIRQPPRFLGREAVALLGGLLSGRAQQRHVVVPTVPQFRRSCGCFGHASSGRRSEPLKVAGPGSFANAQSNIAAHVVEKAGPLVEGLPARWAEDLVAALGQDLEGSTENHFLDALGKLLARTAERGNISAWHHVVSSLRERVMPHLTFDLGQSMHAEGLFGRAYITIGEKAEQAQGQRLLEREEVMLRLEEVSREARTALDWPALCKVLTDHLQRFRIPRYYVAAGNAGAKGESRQVFAFELGKAPELPAGGLAFPTHNVIAPALRPTQRTSILVHSLFMSDEILGHCCQELGPKDGAIVKTFGELISSALKANQLSEALLAEVMRRERAERSRMLQELEIAARIQTAILPKEPRVAGLELATLMRPASEVGGDYFDVVPCEGGCWIGIGDVAGHGVPAGLVMLMIQSLVAATVFGRPDLPPGEAWRIMNTILTSNIRDRMGQDEHATLSLLRYHDDGRLRFVGAHEDLMVYRAETGICERIATPGIWAGISADISEEDTRASECLLGPRDVLLLYTDGILEAKDAAGEQYGQDRLQKLLETVGHLPVQAISDSIMADITKWMTSQEDDITLVVARHTGAARA